MSKTLKQVLGENPNSYAYNAVFKSFKNGEKLMRERRLASLVRNELAAIAMQNHDNDKKDIDDLRSD